MSVTVITPPDDLVTAADAKAWQPVFATDAEARVTALLKAAQAQIEPPDGEIGRAFGMQTLEAQFESFPLCDLLAHGLRLPCPPLRSVVSVKYVDRDGVEQTFAVENYEAVGLGSARGGILLRSDRAWPLSACRPDAVRVRYTAGYAADDPQLMPVKQAVVLAASHLRSLGTQDLALRSREIDGVGSRTWTVSEVAQQLVHSTVDRLLQRYRVYA